MNFFKYFSSTVFLFIFVSACANNPNGKVNSPKSYLEQTNKKSATKQKDEFNLSKDIKGISVDNKAMTYLPPMVSNSTLKHNQQDLTKKFSDKELVKLTVDDLALKDYLHYVLGELLNVSYILGDQLKVDKDTVTLNLQQDISKRKLFTVSESLLSERGYVIRYDEGLYYVHKAEGKGIKGNVVYGYGQKITDVPNTSLNIIQLVPFTFGLQTSLANTLRKIVKIDVTPDFERGALILQGKQKAIVKALEFIHLMDQPAFKNRHIGVYKSTYVAIEQLAKQLPKLLKQEGISVNANQQIDKAISLVPLDRIATLVMFANSQKLIERAGFWAKQIDQAPSGNELQYFLYQPQFARATDLGESLNVLIGGASQGINSTASAAGQNIKISNKTKNKTASSSNENMTLVVDERANALIFNTTGDKYRQLLPLIKRLDVMPKQVILEVMIAEVTLTDVFSQGVEFALTNQGKAAVSGGFNLSSGAAGLKYVLSGIKGQLTLNLLQTNSHVNVLSRPSLLVRDGVTASINVGNDIPTVGEIISSPNVSDKTSVIYRKTGVELRVKPTINARGVIIMEIDQKISKQNPGGASVAGSPIIFERSINTEVVAESGQTIVLGGLISENRTLSDRSVPFFSSIPLVGHLFDSTNDSKDKTELVVLVTPKIIESPDEWDEIKLKLSQNLSELNINQ